MRKNKHQEIISYGLVPNPNGLFSFSPFPSLLTHALYFRDNCLPVISERHNKTSHNLENSIVHSKASGISLCSTKIMQQSYSGNECWENSNSTFISSGNSILTSSTATKLHWILLMAYKLLFVHKKVFICEFWNLLIKRNGNPRTVHFRNNDNRCLSMLK